jgi:predicted acyl esterase
MALPFRKLALAFRATPVRHSPGGGRHLHGKAEPFRTSSGIAAIQGSVLLLLCLFFLCTPLAAQNADAVRARYTKYEYQIPMRDGVKRFTVIYTPKDTSQKYSFALTRTPYSVAPYGIDNYRASLGPSEHFEKEGFIFVYQDARSRRRWGDFSL